MGVPKRKVHRAFQELCSTSANVVLWWAATGVLLETAPLSVPQALRRDNMCAHDRAAHQAPELFPGRSDGRTGRGAPAQGQARRLHADTDGDRTRVDFRAMVEAVSAACPRADRKKGGGPPLCLSEAPVRMVFLLGRYRLSDEQCEHQVRIG